MLGACALPTLGSDADADGDEQASDDDDDWGFGGGGDEGGDGQAGAEGGEEAPVQFDFNCIEIDRVSEPVIVPPAGVQVGFRVLDCEGNPVGPLAPESITVINDEKGEVFGAGKEGGSISGLGQPSDYGLYTVLALDMSESIHKSGALDSMVDGALGFVESLRKYTDATTEHQLAIVVFGRPGTFQIVSDFSDDFDAAEAMLEELRYWESQGSTDLYGSYMEAISLVETRGVGFELVERFVVLMTDGTHEAGDEDSLRESALALKASEPDLNLYTIGIDGAYDPERLAELASTEENFVNVGDATQLSSAFAEIAYRLGATAKSNYAIGVCTPIALGEEASLTIEIEVGTSDTGEMLHTSATVTYPVDQLTGELNSCDPDGVKVHNPGARGGDMRALITADNAYGLGLGNGDALQGYYGNVENVTAGQIFNCGEGPESYVLPAEQLLEADFMYVAAYADQGVTQGLLGQFEEMDEAGQVLNTFYTGDAGWEVCATGIDFELGSGGPSVSLINEQIVACNAGENSGWVDEQGTDRGALVVGEDNTTHRTYPEPGNEFPVVCASEMNAEARWAWFNWDPQNMSWPEQSPFIWPGGTNNPTQEFLIFRRALVE